MIELKADKLVFSCPDVHASAALSISFQRTLRIPDDENDYPLPPGLGEFPLRHIDDHADRVPASWIEHGGVMLPMYQSEAMWLYFDSKYDVERHVDYPFAIKIATGKINAVSGKEWKQGLHRKPTQDYVVVPGQPWLDGYCVEKGIIRQFVAMPLGAGYTAEEQITGKAEHGGLQIMAIPMKREVYEKRFPKREPARFSIGRMPHFSMSDSCAEYGEMGLAPGGRMKQDIYEDEFDLADWDLEQASRCFVHIANSMVWHQITGTKPPTTPPTAKEYTAAGLPWFMWYDDKRAGLKGSKVLGSLKSIATLGRHKKDVPLPENTTVKPQNVIPLRQGLNKNQVREFEEVGQ